jgi:myo-inositol-1(or 4)-monophosphatase
MEEELEFAKGLAQQAGEIMLKHFQVGVLYEHKASEGDTPVTIADTTINKLVIKAVRERYPNYSVIGEEESHHVPGAKFSWVCDPLDGTLPYTLGIPTNVFGLALVNQDGQPVVAVIYDPYMGRKYWATKGGGAFMNDTRIHVNDQSDITKAIVSAPGKRARTLDFDGFRSELFAAAYRPLSFSCTMYEAMLVATGQIATTIYAGWHCHDVATSKLIVEEAGGKVTTMYGGEQRYDGEIDGAVISNGTIHDYVLGLTRKYRKPT